jgi:hypothetical protein
MKLTEPASRFFETERRCGRPGNLSSSFGGMKVEDSMKWRAQRAFWNGSSDRHALGAHQVQPQ